MKRIIPFLVIALAIAAFSLKDRWLPRPADGRYLGYVEGETVLISAPLAGRLVARPVLRGSQVGAGALLFQLDPTAQAAEVARATAAVADSKAQLDNIRTGKRDVEQEIVRAQRREAEAALRYAEQDLTRATELVGNGATTRVRFDQAKSQVSQLRAKVESLKAQEAAGDLGGRLKELEAAEAKVAEAKATRDQAQARLSDLSPVAPVAALVENTFFDVGEWIQAGQPVLSLLAPDKIKLRFFVPQEHIAQAAPGSIIQFRCDGCPPGLRATITYVAPRAEFTPPVIYSDSARRKLVFLVEAKPTAATPQLRAGLPVEVDPIAGKVQ